MSRLCGDHLKRPWSRGKPLSVRRNQKRMEYYALKAGVKAAHRQLRQTMATQVLNADVDLVSIFVTYGLSIMQFSKIWNRRCHRAIPHYLQIPNYYKLLCFSC